MLTRRDFTAGAAASALLLSTPEPSEAWTHGAVSATMPSGATGIWYASDYVTSPRKTIPNSVSPSADPNLLSFPRGAFGNAAVWGNNLGAVTDNNATAPDGSTEASTFVGSAGFWFLYWLTSSNIPAGTYSFCATIRSVSGSTSLKIGDNNTTLTPITITGTRGRYKGTFTTTGTAPSIGIFTGDNLAATIEVCDLQLYSGSSDLNTTWQTAKPISITNMELVVGLTGYETASVSSGAFQHGGLGALQFPSAITPSAFTFLYLAKRSGSRGNAAYNPFIGCADGAGNLYGRFTIGLHSNNFGSTVNNGTPLEGANGTVQFSEDLFAQVGSGPYFGAHRYDGAIASAFVNGAKFLNTPSIAASAVPVRNFLVGGDATTIAGDHDIYVMAYYPRALSDVEIQQAYASLKAKGAAIGAPVSIHRTVCFDGDSITQGNVPGNSFSYAYLFAENTTIACNGANFAVAGNQVSSLVSRGAAVDAVMSGSPSTKFILSIDVGTNDMASTPNNPGAMTTALASYLDARRAAGWKVVVHTILARLDAADGGVQFNTDRHIANTTIRGWVGVHCDAICDIANDPTIGTDAAPNNTTYFHADKIHPLDAAYAIWRPLIVTAIDGLGA